MSTLTRENVRAFATRDWSLARATKDAAVGRFARRRGATGALALARGLTEQVWPRLLEQKRQEEDLSDLVVLLQRLRRAKP